MKEELRQFPLPLNLILPRRVRFWLTKQQASELKRFFRKQPSKKMSLIKDMARASEVGRPCKLFEKEKGKIDRCWIGNQYRLVGAFVNSNYDFLVFDQWEKKQTELKKNQGKLEYLVRNIDGLIANADLSTTPYWSEYEP